MREEDVKRPLRTPAKLRPFPQVSGMRRGTVPTLRELGISKPKQKLNLPDGRVAKGGEEAALSYLRRHAATVLPDQLAPWFSLGCLSLRESYWRVKKAMHKQAATFYDELLWRDFYRYSVSLNSSQ
mmetsp:Transcript_3660/g.9514  ORF Transcript_3660/g.9514 Transcript_3660/m.9514 type:complete len:126 (+) Transcript_3660:247-624(+)